MTSKALLTLAALCTSVALLTGCSNAESPTEENATSSASFASESSITFGDESTITLDADALQSAGVLFDSDDNPGYVLVFAPCALSESATSTTATNIAVQGNDVFVRGQDNTNAPDPTTLLDEIVGTTLEANTEDGIEGFTLAIKVPVSDDEAHKLADGSASAHNAIIDRARNTLTGCTVAIVSDDDKTTYSFTA